MVQVLGAGKWKNGATRQAAAKTTSTGPTERLPCSCTLQYLTPVLCIHLLSRHHRHHQHYHHHYQGSRVLIFSQFKMVLDLIATYLEWKEYGYERIDGNITGRSRQAAIDRFCDPKSRSFVFLLSTRAGGVGINLTVADVVIIFDCDWNPQNDIQAQARAHRIGQQRTVKVYRLITARTYEMTMFDKASRKLGLDQAVLQGITSGDKSKGGKGNGTLVCARREARPALAHNLLVMVTFRWRGGRNRNDQRPQASDHGTTARHAAGTRYAEGTLLCSVSCCTVQPVLTSPFRRRCTFPIATALRSL